MADAAIGTERENAQEQFENVQGKIASLRNTLGGLSNVQGAPPGLLDRAFELQRQTADLEQRVRQKYDGFSDDFRAARERRNTIGEQLSHARGRLPTVRSEIQQAESRIAQLKNTAQQRPNTDAQVAQAEGRLAALQAELQKIEQDSPGLDRDFKSAEAAVSDAEQRGISLLSQPDPDLDRARQEVDGLVGLASTLYKEMTVGLSLAQAGAKAIDIKRDEFKSARDHHRKQAGWLLSGMIVAAIVFAGAVFIVFFLIQPESESTGDPRSALFWLHAVLLFGGRLSAVAGAAWLVVFFGRLHSRHTQQAIIYQDLLAGLDASDMIIQYANAEGRESMLRRMAATYLSLDANAFRPLPAPKKGFSGRDVVRMAKAVTDVAAPLVKGPEK